LGVDTSNADLVESLLASVSAAVREAAGVCITLETSTFTIPTEPSRRVDLPVRPVRSVESVTLDGETVTDYLVRGSAIWRDIPWQRTGAIPGELVIEATHGLDEVPADIVKLVCTLVAAGLIEAEEGLGANRGVSGEGVDDYRISFTRGEDEVVDKTELPERTRNMLR